MKEKIKLAMYQLVAKQGYDKTSLSQIAQAVEIQKPSLYHHFPSKEDIFMATIETYYSELLYVNLGEVEALASPQAYRDYFRQYGLDVMADFQNDRELRLFCDEINLQEQRNPRIAERVRAYDQRVVDTLAKLFARGESLEAFAPGVNLERELPTLMVMLLGLTEVQLFSIDIDSTLVWEHYMERLFQ